MRGNARTVAGDGPTPARPRLPGWQAVLPRRMAGRRPGIAGTGSSLAGTGSSPMGKARIHQGAARTFEGSRHPQRGEGWSWGTATSPAGMGSYPCCRAFAPGWPRRRPRLPGDGFPRFFDGPGMLRGSGRLTEAVANVSAARPFEMERALAADLHEAHQVAVVAGGEHVLGQASPGRRGGSRPRGRRPGRRCRGEGAAGGCGRRRGRGAARRGRSGAGGCTRRRRCGRGG